MATIPRASARTTLSRETIVRAAMQLSAGSTKPLTLAALGRALGADPTAVYRHFRSRDDLLLAMGDQLYSQVQVQARGAAGTTWREELSAWALAFRRTYLEYPALATEVAYRFTGGPNEQAGVDDLMARLVDAGFDPVTAGRHTRALAELVLGHIGLTATLISLPEELQERDVTVGLRIYPAPDQGPTTTALVARAVATARDDEDAVFALQLDTYLDGLAAQLPHPRQGVHALQT